MRNPKYLLFIFGVFFIVPKIALANTVRQSRSCAVTKKTGLASCNVHVVTDDKGNFLVNANPVSFTPQDLRAAYKINGKTQGTKIVAIVDAYDDTAIKQDLDVYSKQFNLPILPLCKSSVEESTIPCFAKINQRGKTTPPKANSSWAMEIALDVEAVHALCENCSILLVEADSTNMKNLAAAVDMAVKSGATVVSNSYGGPEFPQETEFDSHFNHPGIAFTVSSGDSGYGVEYPASSPFVTAVGGTSLYLTNGIYKNEVAWSGAGSGCSQYEQKPTWQTDSKCQNRTVADVSAVADPATGFAIYSSISNGGKKGWFTVGGTSLAAPLIATVYAISNNIPKGQMANSLPYSMGSKNNLHDIIGGNNGDCSPAYLCTAKTKYDGPTGLGSPKGVSAF